LFALNVRAARVSVFATALRLFTFLNRPKGFWIDSRFAGFQVKQSNDD